MSIVNIDRLPPAEVKRLQTPAQGSPCGCNDCRRQRVLDRLKADVQSGAYRDDGPELDASLDKLQAAIDAAKAPETLAESMHKPDLAERERAAFDELNDGDRWDGLS
jgi:hypothetical protein